MGGCSSCGTQLRRGFLYEGAVSPNQEGQDKNIHAVKDRDNCNAQAEPDGHLLDNPEPATRTGGAADIQQQEPEAE